MKDRKRFIKASIAVLIGVALIFVSWFLGFTPIGALVIAVIAAIFGPVAGLIATFFEIVIDRNIYFIYYNHSPSFNFLVGSLLRLLYGLSIGLFRNYFGIDAKKVLTDKTLIQFNLAQIIANFLFRRLMISVPDEHFYFDTFIVEIVTTAVFGTLFIYIYVKVKNRQPAIVSAQNAGAGYTVPPPAEDSWIGNAPPSHTAPDLMPPSTGMDPGFLTILQKIAAERGPTIFDSPVRCRALLQDYAAGAYKKESRILLLAVEAGFPREIVNAAEPDIVRQRLINRLHEDYSLDVEAAETIIRVLFAVIGNKEE
jgi:hypothetical protein